MQAAPFARGSRTASPTYTSRSMAALIAAHSRPTVPCTARSVWVTCSTAPQPGSSQPGGGDGRQQRGQQQQRGSRLKGAAAEAVAAGGRPRRWCEGFGRSVGGCWPSGVVQHLFRLTG